ncbi:MAG: hypothetical protein NVS9B10_27150 [Nevskia sp.]
MSPLLLLVPASLLRLWLLRRQRRVLAADASAAYARAVVTQRVGQQLWQSLSALLLLLPASIAAIESLERDQGATVALGALVVAGWFWELPAKAWKVFVTDARHGFNRLTAARFLCEQAGRAALFAAIAVPAAALAVQLFERAGSLWWLALWALGWLGYTSLRWLQPRYVAPLFDPLEPLPESPLRTRLQAFLTQRGVARQQLFLLRSSARTAQANAQVLGGFGGSAAAPRIVLTDTLIERLPAEQIEAVVAHELGHLQRGHLRVQMRMIGALSLAQVAVVALLTRALPGSAPQLALAWALLPSGWLFALPVVNAVYRRFEFEADEAAASASSATAMAGALRTLTRNNANATQADPWYERVYHTHPALAARLERLDRAAA